MFTLNPHAWMKILATIAAIVLVLIACHLIAKRRRQRQHRSAKVFNWETALTSERAATSREHCGARQDFQPTWPQEIAERPSVQHLQGGLSTLKGNRHRYPKNRSHQAWVSVRSYFRRDGTHVSSYLRRAIFGALSFVGTTYRAAVSKRVPAMPPSRVGNTPIPMASPWQDAPEQARNTEPATVQPSPIEVERRESHSSPPSRTSSVAPVSIVSAFQPRAKVSTIRPIYGGGRTVVKGHYRKNGTYVSAHVRRSSAVSAWKATRRK